jgi:hypothetical protein
VIAAACPDVVIRVILLEAHALCLVDASATWDTLGPIVTLVGVFHRFRHLMCFVTIDHFVAQRVSHSTMPPHHRLSELLITRMHPFISTSLAILLLQALRWVE